MKRELRLFDELDRFANPTITHALALTFGYDGDVAQERLWRPLVERFGVHHPLVITGGGGDAGTTLGVHVVRAGAGTGIFHPKLFLALRDDAAFVAIGSANLTKGGLGANLELVTPLVFSKEQRSAPRSMLLDVLGLLDTHVIGRLQAAPTTTKIARDMLAYARVVADALPDRSRGPDLRFIHSAKEALWPQLLRAHGTDPVERVLVISPFFEDPNAEENDSLLRYVMADGVPWSPRARRPRCVIHTRALTPGLQLPKQALEELQGDAELRVQKQSFEPRLLHAKLVALIGRKRVTLLWGSPNFTPSALRKPASDRGNLETALLMSADAKQLTEEQLAQGFELADLFAPPAGPLPDPVPVPFSPPAFDVGEIVYDPSTHTLTLFGEVFSASVTAMSVELINGDERSAILSGRVNGTGPLKLETVASNLEEEDPETGRRRLRGTHVVVRALDASGATLLEIPLRLNVVFDDALELRENLLLGPEGLSADALLVPALAPPEQRVAALDGKIAAWKAARKGDGLVQPQHQPSLDRFFRNVRHGLDARWNELVSRKGSRFALLRWSAILQRSMRKAAESEYDAPRLGFYVASVTEHVERVLDELPKWHTDLESVKPLLGARELAAGLSKLDVSSGALVEHVARELRDARSRTVHRLEAFE